MTEKQQRRLQEGDQDRVLSVDLTAPLKTEEITATQNGGKKAAHDKSAKTPIIPVPADASPCNFAMPDFGGKPTNLYPYHQADGQLIGYVARWDIINKETGESVWNK